MTGARLVRVQLERVPLRLYERTGQHTAELVREFRLITLSGGTSDLPARLSRLVTELQARYADIGEEPKRMRQEALSAGLLTIDLGYQVPPAVGSASLELLELLREADAHCRGDLLMTLPAAPDQVAFREWYLGEFVRQTRGEPALPWSGSLD